MDRKKIVLICSTFLFAVIGGYFYFFNHKNHSHRIQIGENLWISGDVIFAQMPVQDQIKQSDFIVLGTITNISGTKWNQDSGEYWEAEVDDGQLHSPLAYYTITVLKEKVIAGKDGSKGESIDLTVTTLSPLDTNDSTFTLDVGDKGIFMVVQSYIDWYDGDTKPVFIMLSHPDASVYKQLPNKSFSILGESEEVPLGILISDINKLRTTKDIMIPVDE